MSVATTSERASAYAWANLNGRSNLIDFMKALGSGAVSYRRRISRLRGGSSVGDDAVWPTGLPGAGGQLDLRDSDHCGAEATPAGTDSGACARSPPAAGARTAGP